jgi:hypothetical protein
MSIALEPRLAGLPDALAGEFELETALGRGGMGVVFRAIDASPSSRSILDEDPQGHP